MNVDGPQELSISWSVVSRTRMTSLLHDEVVALCSRAYEEDLAPLMATWRDGVHLLGRQGDRLVSHVLWVERSLQSGSLSPMRTAYIEALATDQDHRRRGYASQAMRFVADQIAEFEVGALSPFDWHWYARLGWVRWRGPLFIRTASGPLATPAEEVMVPRLPRTPPLDLASPLSAEWREGELW